MRSLSSPLRLVFRHSAARSTQQADTYRVGINAEALIV